MTFDISAPGLGKNKKPVKDMVLDVLTQEHPLSLSKITLRIVRGYRAPVTFQGVRKAVNHLVSEGVLVRNEKEYAIDKDWILKLRDYAERVHGAYFEHKASITGVESVGEDVKVYRFSNAIDLDMFWDVVLNKWYDSIRLPKKDTVYVQYSGHTWYVLANLEQETKILDTIRKKCHSFYTYCPSNTPLDKWSQKYYQKLGFFYEYGNGTESARHYYSVYADRIIQCDYPESVAKKLDELYAKSSDFKNLDVAELIQILQKKNEYKVTVMKNRVVADQLREFILSKFKKNQKMN